VQGIEVVLFYLVMSLGVSTAECWSSDHRNGCVVCLFVRSKTWRVIFSSYISLQTVRMNE